MMQHTQIDRLETVRNRLNALMQQTLDTLAESEEIIELPVMVQFAEEVTFDRQQARTIAATVLKGIVNKQILIAVSQTPRTQAIEVGYLEPPSREGKFISAIISPDYAEKIDNPTEALKKTIVEIHALDLMSIASGVQLIPHGIAVDRIVYSINLG